MEKRPNESQPASSEKSIVIDLGKRKKKAIKNLRKGKGKLVDEVHDCINELRTAGEIEGAVRPVVVVVREKSRGPRWF